MVNKLKMYYLLQNKVISLRSILFISLNIRNLAEFHNLYVGLDTALLADVFENFRDKHIEIDKLDTTYFLTTPGLLWWACLKKQVLN